MTADATDLRNVGRETSTHRPLTPPSPPVAAARPTQVPDGFAWATACSCCGPRQWGSSWELGTAAFWVGQVQARSDEGPAIPDGRHALGYSLREEVVACMLGGHGVPGDIGVAAFRVLRDDGLLSHESYLDVERARLLLSRPFKVPGRPRSVRYRFHQQRPARIGEALRALQAWLTDSDRLDDVELRDRLMTLPGVGPKTASWVVRNHRSSDRVAIIDIHVRRAGTAAGLFCSEWQLPRDYKLFEDAFLEWAETGDVSAGDLDATIWRWCARMGRDVSILFAGAGRD